MIHDLYLIMTLIIYTDGGSLNNPGEAAIAYAIYLDKKLVLKYSKRIGVASNNVAEYTALLEALQEVTKLIFKHSVTEITIYSDSQLMVNQINGLYKVKNTPLHELLMKIRLLERDIAIPIKYTHVVREKNTVTDAMVKRELGK